MLLALTEGPVFQSSVFFQVTVSAAKAVDFPNYGVEIFIAWEQNGHAAYLQHLFVNYRNLMIITPLLCTSTAQDSLIMSFKRPIHFGNYM